MYRHLLIDILVFSGPFLFSFRKKAKFYRRIPYILAAFFSVDIVFLALDIWAPDRGPGDFPSHKPWEPGFWDYLSRKYCSF